MALKFTITEETSQGAKGTLEWTEKDLSSKAISGPYGNGRLPDGVYYAKRNFLLDKDGEKPYCDKKDNCWFQRIDSDPNNGRTDLGIHPDGNTLGTQGCIGISDSDTKKWYDAFFNIGHGKKTKLVVETAISA